MSSVSGTLVSELLLNKSVWFSTNGVIHVCVCVFVFEKLIVDQLLSTFMATVGRNTGVTSRPGYIPSSCRHS